MKAPLSLITPLIAAALLVPARPAWCVGDGAGVAGPSFPSSPDDTNPKVLPGGDPRTTSNTGASSTPLEPRSSDPRTSKPQGPQITTGGQDALADYRNRLQGGHQVNPVDYFSRVLQTEGPGAMRWIEWMARTAAQSGGGDVTSVRVRLWQRYVVEYPNDPKGYSGLGKNDFSLGNFGPAVADYTKAIELGDVSPENLYGRGLAAERAGDYELAHQDSGMALSMDPRNRTAESLYKLTDGRVSKTYVDLTTGLLKNVARKDGQGEKSDGAVGVQGGGGTKAAPAVRTETTDPRRLSASLTQEAQRLLRLGDLRSGVDAARRAATLNPENAQALNLLATGYERLGLHDEAVKGADQALKIQPDSVAALNTRAWAKSGLKRFTEALGDASRVVALDPSNAFGYLNEARAYGGLGRRDEMLEAVGRTASLDPRFGSLKDQAFQLAPSGDTELLFAGALDGQPQAPFQGRRPQKGSQLLFITLATLCGGFLIALGLLHALSPAWRQRVTARLLGRPAPGYTDLPDLGGAPGAGSGEAGTGSRGSGRALGESPGSPDSPHRIGGFEIKRVLATGGMGQVFEAVDEKLGRRVAIKKLRAEIRDDAKERERFLREARTVAGLRHPNIVQIHSVVEDGPDIYLVFEFVDGRPLEKMLAEKGALPWPRVLALLKGICAALDHAHAQGVIHRDLKPSNIMVETDGNVRVMDFGVARQVKEVLTRSTSTNTVWGTPCYMSPEAEEGKVSRAADIYSLGVCVYEMATGEVPFTGAAGAMFAAKAAGKFVPASTHEPGLPKGIDEVLGRALSPDTRLRQVSAMQLLTELRALR